jgi:hypothetical protein
MFGLEALEDIIGNALESSLKASIESSSHRRLPHESHPNDYMII